MTGLCKLKNMKAHVILLIILTLQILAGAGRLNAQKVNIQVYPEIKKQVIQSIGANYAQANYTDHAWDVIGEYTLREFQPSHVRVALPMKLRGKDYEQYMGEKFTKQPIVIKVLETIKRMKDEYGVKNFTISVWNVPDELVENPSERSQRVIRPESYPEVIQMLVHFLLKAKHEYGVEVDYFSFNESDGGWMVLFTPEETIDFLKKLAEKITEAGLKTKFLWADTHKTKGTVEFATQIMADTALWDDLGPLCFHSWWSENIPDSEFERIAGLAKAWERPVWCSELGFDAMAHRKPGMKKSWDYGLRFAKIFHRMLKYAEVEVSMYWTWQNNYAIMSADTKEKYPSYYVTRHHVEYLNTGTQIVQSISSHPDILPLSGIMPDRNNVLQLINLQGNPIAVKIKGVKGNQIKQVITTEDNLWETKDNIGAAEDGLFSVELKPASINTFVFK